MVLHNKPTTKIDADATRHENHCSCNKPLNCAGTEVKTDTSFNDDFPPDNLVSSDPLIRAKGFLADYFIKPPVGVSFSFRHPVHLCRLAFQPRVGQQSCQAFEVWARTPEHTEGWAPSYSSFMDLQRSGVAAKIFITGSRHEGFVLP
jgi:hypothetical protein